MGVTFMTARRIRHLLLVCSTAIALFALFNIRITHLKIGAKTLAADTVPTVEPVNYLPVVLLGSTATPSCVPPPEITSSDLANEAAIQAGITQRREQNDLDPLNQASETVQAARRHSLDMAGWA